MTDEASYEIGYGVFLFCFTFFSGIVIIIWGGVVI